MSGFKCLCVEACAGLAVWRVMIIFWLDFLSAIPIIYAFFSTQFFKWREIVMSQLKKEDIAVLFRVVMNLLLSSCFWAVGNDEKFTILGTTVAMVHAL